jgi:hypothetical protein
MGDRPEYITCIADDNVLNDSWCKRYIRNEFHFEDIGQAVREGLREGRLVTCRDCRNVIVKGLDAGSDDENI